MKRLCFYLFIGVLILPLGACEREEEPAEELGESIDETREDVQDAVEDTAEEVD